MNRCAAIQRGMYDRTHAGFERLGLAVALRPWRTIATSLTVAIMLTGCVFAGQWEARIEYRDVPRGTEGFSLYDEVVIPLFGLTPRINEFKAYAADGGNVLRKELMLEALTVHERVLELSAATGGDGANVTTYADICVRSFEGGGCKMDNVFLRLALDRPSLLAMEQAEIDARFLAQSGGLERLLGHLEVDEEARTVRATNLRFFYLASEVVGAKTIAALVSGPPEAQARRVVWENLALPLPLPLTLPVALPLPSPLRLSLPVALTLKARRVAWENEFLSLLNPAGSTGLDAATPPWESSTLVLAAVAGRSLMDEITP